MKDKVLRWGICSAGKICNDFVLALNSLPKSEHQVHAVAARDLTRAQSFADFHSIPKFYSSYAELSKDNDIDVVYIGVIHTGHYEVSRMMIAAGKHVLCEKPLCVNLDETIKLVEYARSKNIFLMEAVWSRCFPAYQKAKELIESGVIGTVRFCHATFGSHVDFPLPRIERKDMAGGALLDIGIYSVQFAQFAYNHEEPVNQATTGQLMESGVDSDANIILEYGEGRSASVSCSVKTFLSNQGSIHGTQGYLKILSLPSATVGMPELAADVHKFRNLEHQLTVIGPYFWCPTTVEVYSKHNKSDEHHYELPPVPDKGKYNFRNSQGLQYEASEVRRCLLNGWIESPLMTGDMSIQVARILFNSRQAIGYELPQDRVQR